MLTIGFAGLRRNALAQWGIVAAPLLLLIAPALHYSLDTPIGTLESSPYLAHKFDSASEFFYFLRTTIFESVRRFRPFYDFWNGLAWKLFGDLAWPHYLMRWLIFFGAVALSIAAFRRISGWPHSADAPHQRAAGLLRITPPALLAYSWLLFPSTVIVRIECVELYTVFFLGLCNWAAALMLTAEGGKPCSRQTSLRALGLGH